MARDDYSIIAYKILVYLYACKKRKVVFEEVALRKAAGADKLHEDYFMDVFRMLQDEGMIKGLAFTRAWGNEYILSSGLSEAEITADGIRYLSDNSKASEIKEMLIRSVDTIAGLIKIVNL